MSVQTPTKIPMSNSPNRARAKETLWRLSALAFGHPTREFHEALNIGEFQDAFDQAWSAVTGRNWPYTKPGNDFPDYEAGYIYAFGHGPGGKPVAALLAGDHEELLAGLTRPVFMLNLTAMYKHFGLKAAKDDEGRDDEPDHLASMLEFMSVLCHLEANAVLRSQDPSHYQRAQRDFLCRYLKPFLESLNQALQHGKTRDLDPNLVQILQDIKSWSDLQVYEFEAKVGPFRSVEKFEINGSPNSMASQNLWN